MSAAIGAIQAARDAGIDVTADMYPYAGSGTGLSSILPPWVAEGGNFYETLAGPAIQARVRAEVPAPAGDWEALAHDTGPEHVMPVGFERPENGQFAISCPLQCMVVSRSATRRAGHPCHLMQLQPLPGDYESSASFSEKLPVLW